MALQTVIGRGGFVFLTPLPWPKRWDPPRNSHELLITLTELFRWHSSTWAHGRPSVAYNKLLRMGVLDSERGWNTDYAVVRQGVALSIVVATHVGLVWSACLLRCCRGWTAAL